jgi:glycosyltransferase involved in cell wall biosynthesis
MQEVAASEHGAAELALRLADTWFSGLGLEHSDIALGPLLRYKVGGYNVHLHGLCRQAYKARALLELYRPKRVVLAEPALMPAGAFLEKLGRQEGVRIRSLLPGWARTVVRALANRLFYTIGYSRTEVPLFQVPAECSQGQVGGRSWALFVASMENYVNPMLPVMRALGQQGVETLALVPGTARHWRRYAELAKLSYVVLAEQLVDAPAMSELTAKRREYRARFRECRQVLRHRLRLEDGLELWPFAAPGMRVVFSHLLPHLVGYIGLAERLCRSFRPRVLVIARQRRAFENACVAVASRDGIPSAMLIHGHISSHPEYQFVDGRFDQVDLICSWGEAQKTALIEKQASPDRVVVTGNPQWDRLSTSLGDLGPRAACRRQLAGQIGASEEAFWVTFTSQAVSRAFLPAILATVRALPGVALIIKVHPAEQARDYQTVVSASDREWCRVVKDVDLHTLLRASDVVLTFTSTTNLEALAVGTPLCVLDWGDPDMPQRVNLGAYGIPSVQNGQELSEALSRMQQDRAWQDEILSGGSRALADYARGLDGHATDRVVEALLALMETGSGEVRRGRDEPS